MQKYRTLLVRETLSKDFDKAFSQKIDEHAKVYEIMKMLNADMQLEEHMWVVHLNTAQNATGVTEVSNGALDHTTATPAEVFRTAILSGAAAIVLVHNHPSGNTTPSSDDIVTTQRLVEAGKVIGIPVIDHLIIGANGYTSLAETDIRVFI
jgi:DNA repair protein RadC